MSNTSSAAYFHVQPTLEVEESKKCSAPCPSCADNLGCWYKSGDAAEPK